MNSDERHIHAFLEWSGTRCVPGNVYLVQPFQNPPQPSSAIYQGSGDKGFGGR